MIAEAQPYLMFLFPVNIGVLSESLVVTGSQLRLNETLRADHGDMIPVTKKRCDRVCVRGENCVVLLILMAICNIKVTGIYLSVFGVQ